MWSIYTETCNHHQLETMQIGESQGDMQIGECMQIRSHLHGKGSMWNRTGTVRIGFAFTRELMEPFHTEPLAVPELVHLERKSLTEPNQKVLR